MRALFLELMLLKRVPPRGAIVVIWWAFLIYCLVWVATGTYACYPCGTVGWELVYLLAIYAVYFSLSAAFMYVVLKAIERLLYGDAEQGERE